MLKRLGAAIALLVLCGTLYIDTPSHAAGLPTEKKVCPPGYELKTIKEAPSGKTVRLWFKKDKTKTVCVRVKEVHVGDKAASSRQDYCREGRIEGISQAEMGAGVLTINGDRWVRCGPGANSLHRISVDLDALARSLAVQLQLPDTTPIFGPDPNNNEWKMLTVGFPVWLTTQGPRHKATTASAQGLTFRLSADLQSTTFAMGDGSQVTCTAISVHGVVEGRRTVADVWPHLHQAVIAEGLVHRHRHRQLVDSLERRRLLGQLPDVVFRFRTARDRRTAGAQPLSRSAVRPACRCGTGSAGWQAAAGRSAAARTPAWRRCRRSLRCGRRRRGAG